jgi:hypothetical protein
MDVNAAIALATRARGKAKRAFLRAPLVKQVAETRYFAALGRHAAHLPWLDPVRFSVLKDLRQHFFTKRDGSAFIPPDVLDVAKDFVARLENDTTDRSSVRISPAELAADPALFKWGLSDENLDLAESYIGLPVSFLGVEVKRERPDGRVSDVRQWHIDVEDRRMMKIITYLSDVDDTCGPFNYHDRPLTRRAVKKLNYWSGFVPDAQMNEAVPSHEWLQALGPRLTTVFVDTCRLFHRAMPPTKRDRYSMTFSYSSNTPFQVFPEFMQDRKTLMRLRDQLAPRQRRAAKMD